VSSARHLEPTRPAVGNSGEISQAGTRRRSRSRPRSRNSRGSPDIRGGKGWSLYQYLTILLMAIQIAKFEWLSGGITEQQIDQLYYEFVEAHPVIRPSPATSAESVRH
jgi:hypothetical protein